MGKLPCLNPKSDSNPPKKSKQFHRSANGELDDSPASDDAYSFIRKPNESSRHGGFNNSGYLTYNVSACSKTELCDLRKKLVSELDQIRKLQDLIELGKFGEISKKLTGNKRPAAAADPSNKRVTNGNVEGSFRNIVCLMDEKLMKECKSILVKLMKHKHGWVFSTPVDTVKLGLHDYHQIIKSPMDLGTVKTNMSKNAYSSAADFAADVRLTFNNAMLYNPKTHEVHELARVLLSRFEDLFRPIQQKFSVDDRRERFGGSPVGELQGNSWNHTVGREKVKKPKLNPVDKELERIRSHSSAATMSNTPSLAIPPKAQSPVPAPSPKKDPPTKSWEPSQVVDRGPTGKQPKPKAKDPNKREMTMDEKHKLGIELQGLPQEKMPQLVHIIKKRNGHLAQDGDEIELDIEALDTETLWELDRFVTNWKKMVSKTRRQAMMINNNNPAAATNASTAGVDDRGAFIEGDDLAKKLGKGEIGDGDVDIDDDDGDDIPASSYPPMEIAKDEVVVQDHGNADSSSGSSSSSSDSSSSSGTESGSSSQSGDSDADDAQS